VGQEGADPHDLVPERRHTLAIWLDVVRVSRELIRLEMGRDAERKENPIPDT
jgi:hypothetical protein